MGTFHYSSTYVYKHRQVDEDSQLCTIFKVISSLISRFRTLDKLDEFQYFLIETVRPLHIFCHPPHRQYRGEKTVTDYHGFGESTKADQ